MTEKAFKESLLQSQNVKKNVFLLICNRYFHKSFEAISEVMGNLGLNFHNMGPLRPRLYTIPSKTVHYYGARWQDNGSKYNEEVTAAFHHNRSSSRIRNEVQRFATIRHRVGIGTVV